MGLLVPPIQAAPLARTYAANFSGRPTTTWGTTLTASASTHTLGTVAQVIASTPYDCDAIRVSIHGMYISATLTDALCNIYIGASNEKVLIPNLIAGWSATNIVATPRVYYFPIRIARGTRIAAALRSLIASDVAYIQVELLSFNGMVWSGTAVETLGANTGTSKGANVTPGTTSEGAWASIGTSTKKYGYILPVMQGNADTTATATHFGLDIGVGSAAISGLENFGVVASATEWVNAASEMGRVCDIASGSALQARLQGHTTDTEVKNVILYGVY